VGDLITDNHSLHYLAWEERAHGEEERLYWRGRWIHQAEGTPASRRGEEEAARATATRFFFVDGRMRGRACFFLFCFLFVSFVWGLNGEKENGGPQGSIMTTGTGFSFLMSRIVGPLIGV
jgi:hypothetical protein